MVLFLFFKIKINFYFIKINLKLTELNQTSHPGLITHHSLLVLPYITVKHKTCFEMVEDMCERNEKMASTFLEKLIGFHVYHANPLLLWFFFYNIVLTRRMLEHFFMNIYILCALSAYINDWRYKIDTVIKACMR